MMASFAIIIALLIPCTWSYSEDSYPLSDIPESNYIDEYPEENKDIANYEVNRRSNSNFLRFGRGDNKYLNDFEYDDYADTFLRPTRNDRKQKDGHHIRFGRSNDNGFLRFGRADAGNKMNKVLPDRAPHLRFRRSATEENKTRNKRDTNTPEKKRLSSNNYLRFGRGNENFLRFGRVFNVPDKVDSTPDSPDNAQQDVKKLDLNAIRRIMLWCGQV